MTNQNMVQQKANYYKCANCGNILTFNPTTQQLHCKNCNTNTTIIHIPPPQKHNFEQPQEHSEKYKEWINTHKTCKCENCGSSIILNTLDIATTCPYCNTAFVVDRTSLPQIIPDAVIPFAFDKTSAGLQFQAFAKKKFYVNGKFKKCLPEKLIIGTYIPSFLFDANSYTNYSGQLYKQETVHTHNGTTTQLVPFHVKGSISVKHLNILVESSTILNQNDINGLFPFDYSKAYAFKDDYILGYNVEYYNDSLAQTNQTAHIIYENQIKQQILKKYPQATSIKYLNLQKSITNQQYALYLVPIYRFEYTFKKKKYITYMNGQTGKVNNNLPKSLPKIIATILLPVLLILLCIFLS